MKWDLVGSSLFKYGLIQTGKSCQLCAHFASIAYHRQNAESSSTAAAVFLIVAPATVLHHWLDELNNWAPELRVVIMHSISPFFRSMQQREVAGMSPHQREKLIL